MLGLFKEEVSLNQEEAFVAAKRLLVSSLNKGLIPSWEHFFQELPVLDSVDCLDHIKQHFMTMIDWPFLEEILSLEATEFFFHSPEHTQRLLLSGQKENISVPLSVQDWQTWLEVVAIKYRQNWNIQQPFASFHAELFGKNYRLSLIHGSTAPDGKSKLILRSLAQAAFPLQTFGEDEHILPLVLQKKNILIAGSTGSGKTSLLSAMLEHIRRDEHLVILEDTYEIISSHPYQTRLLAADSPQKSLKSYLSYVLRLSPDRMVLGEMRSHEVVPFLLAMNTGHRGLLSTIHAASAPDALNRVALLFSLYGGEAGINYERVMELMCRNLEYVVFMEHKKVKEIIRVLGCDKGVPFFETVTGSKEREFQF
jgi:type IV secretion system protein VirB11